MCYNGILKSQKSIKKHVWLKKIIAILSEPHLLHLVCNPDLDSGFLPLGILGGPSDRQLLEEDAPCCLLAGGCC